MHSDLALLQYDSGSGSSAAMAFVMLVYLAAAVFFVVCQWKVFTKAGREGWEALVPVYNVYVLLKIVGRPGWWLVLFFIPFVNLVAFVILLVDLAKSFGKGIGYGIGLFFLSIIFWPMLAFGSAQYQGPAAADDLSRQQAVGGSSPAGGSDSVR